MVKSGMKTHWMANAVKHPGALHRTAASEGGLNPDGTISKNWEAKKAAQGGTTGRRARLAETFAKYR